MKFFILIHSVSSLVCLNKLIKKGYAPDLVIAHDKYEREKLDKVFFTPVKKLCKRFNIKFIESDYPNDFKVDVRNYEIGFCVGYMKILRKDFFEIPKYGIFNLHCGKLPEYRGRAPISRTIMNGDENLIASLHKIDEGVDSGPVAIETKIKITLKDDVNTLYEKFSENSYKSIVELLKILKNGKLKLRKQRTTNRKPYTRLTEEECRIDWGKGQLTVFNKIRALKFPYPGAFTKLKDKKYIINDAVITKRNVSGKPGMIREVKSDAIYITVKSGVIKASDIYCGGKKVNIVKEFLTGDKFI
ncbi:MAG: methionyl-tRNA formyltransferase [Bacteroidetes bacterium]|nr:methionyl-tRNA formyltransferase [Bacteroidota bacterium]